MSLIVRATAKPTEHWEACRDKEPKKVWEISPAKSVNSQSCNCSKLISC